MELHSMRILSLLLLALTSSASSSDDGFCSVDPASKEGSPSSSSCSGGGNASPSQTDSLKEPVSENVVYEGKEETANETETWARLAYSKLAFTNALDWSIRDALDLADELITVEPEKAIAAFNKILAAHPASVRAHYALVRSMQFVNTTEWAEEKKLKHDQDIHEKFMKIMKGDEAEVLFPIFYAAAHQGLLHAVGLNDTAKKTEILKLAISLRSAKHEKFHELLIYEYILNEQYDEALKAVDVAAEEFHLSKHFKFLKGIVLKKLDRKKEANALLRAVEASPNDVFIFGTDVMELCDELTRRGGREQDVDMIYKEASKMHLFMSRYQRPMEVVPDLESKPFWSLEDDVGLTTHEEELTILRSNLQAITAEAVELRKNASLWMRNEYFVDGGAWEEFPLYSWGKRRGYHCSLAPKTCEVLKRFPAASGCRKCTVKFHALAPKTHVRTHVGPTNARLRMHVTLRAPKEGRARIRVGRDEVREWVVGEEVVFDDSFEHELWNEDEEEERLVLSVDLPHPDVRDVKTAFSAEAKNVYLLY